MALPKNVKMDNSKDNKLANGAALAALEEGWMQYKESLRSPKAARTLLTSQTTNSQVSPSAGNGKVCILSIDGGGMRGIIPAKILTYLEETLKKKSGNPEARIADYFDIAAGTSVGGLISTMLFTGDGEGRPMFSAQNALELISEKGKQIFSLTPWKRPLAMLRGILTPRYSTKHLENLLKEHLVRNGRELTLKDTLKPVLIPCYDLCSAGAFLFSRADALEADSFDFRLWEVCRATSAVPGFFKPAHLSSVDGKTSCTAIDGGLIMNNPTAAAVTHVFHNKVEFPQVRSLDDMLVLSLGTGLFDQPYSFRQVRRWGAFQWAKPIVRIVLDGISDMVDHTMSMAFQEHRRNYVRMQVSGLPGSCLTKMDDPSKANVRWLSKVADDMLEQKTMEHVPFGGKRVLPVTNRERLEWFADCLVAEHRARAARASPTVLFKPGNCASPVIS